MTAPQLTVYADGQGAVSGDGLNTFVQSADSMSDLRSFVGVQGVQVYVRGTSTPGDGGQGNFFWNVNGTAADDNGVTTVVPSGSGSGIWTRLTNQQPGVRQTGTPTAGTTTNTASITMVGTNQPFVPASTGNFLIIISGAASNSVSTNGGLIILRYGSGAPPVAGSIEVGTGVGQAIRPTSAFAGQLLPFTVQGYVPGLTLGTPYWIDLAFEAIIGGTFSLSDLVSTVIEV